MIIDFHTHIFPPKIKQDRSPYLSDPCFAALYSDKKAWLATAEELVENMDKEGIDVSVALNIGWTKHEVCIETNDYIMEAVSRYPKRLVGFGAVQPRATDAALREIERCARGGMRGVGEIRPDLQQLGPQDKGVMKPFIETVIEHRLVLLTHASEPVGHQYQGKGAVTPEILYSLITEFPELTLVCAHWGGGLPFYALMPEVKRAMSDTFFDTAASPFLYSPQIYTQVIQLIGAEKILFGSDFPLLRPSRLLKEIDSLDLPVKQKELILSGNARRLLGI